MMGLDEKLLLKRLHSIVINTLYARQRASPDQWIRTENSGRILRVYELVFSQECQGREVN